MTIRRSLMIGSLMGSALLIVGFVKLWMLDPKIVRYNEGLCVSQPRLYEMTKLDRLDVCVKATYARQLRSIQYIEFPGIAIMFLAAAGLVILKQREQAREK